MVEWFLLRRFAIPLKEKSTTRQPTIRIPITGSTLGTANHSNHVKRKYDKGKWCQLNQNVQHHTTHQKRLHKVPDIPSPRDPLRQNYNQLLPFNSYTLPATPNIPFRSQNIATEKVLYELGNIGLCNWGGSSSVEKSICLSQNNPQSIKVEGVNLTC